jgi:hypothetical protein
LTLQNKAHIFPHIFALMSISMGQVTIYLDPDTEAKMRTAAESLGISKSKWIAKLIQEKTANSWPDFVYKLAGAWQEDMPSAQEIRATMGHDTPREPL